VVKLVLTEHYSNGERDAYPQLELTLQVR